MSVKPLFLSGASVLRHKCRVHFDGVSLVSVDPLLTVHGFPLGFSVGHAEDVVGLDPAVDSTIPGDGHAKVKGFVPGFFNSVEGLGSLIFALALLVFHTQVHVAEENSLVLLETLGFHHIVHFLVANTVKLVHCGRGNTLQPFREGKELPVCRSLRLFEHRRFGLWFRGCSRRG